MADRGPVDGRQRGWFWIENDLLSLPLSSHAKWIYAVLCRHADGEGRSFPSHTMLARESGLSRSSVQRAIQELIGGAHVTVTPGKSGGSNVYVLHSVGGGVRHTDAGVRQGDAGGCVTQTQGVRQGDAQKEYPEKEREELRVDRPPKQALIAHYCDRWKRHYGTSVPISGPDAGKLVRLLVGRSLDEATALVDRYFDDEDPFASRTGHSIGALVSMLPRLVARQTTGSLDGEEFYPPGMGLLEPGGKGPR